MPQFKLCLPLGTLGISDPCEDSFMMSVLCPKVHKEVATKMNQGYHLFQDVEKPGIFLMGSIEDKG